MRTLHCTASGDEKGWEAICLDLDIAVQGPTFEDVYRSLHQAVAVYQASLADLPEAERTRLLHRPAPLSVRLKFLGFAIRSLLPGNGHGGYRHDFTMPMAA